MGWFLRASLKDPLFEAPLKRTSNGFYYLDVPQSFATGLFRMLSNKQAQETPYKEEKYNKIGAHVSVIHEDEIDKIDGLRIKEIGEMFEFSLGQAKFTSPESWDGMKNVWFMQIEAPSLMDLRQKYDLPKTYNGKGHKFHITFAIQPDN